MGWDATNRKGVLLSYSGSTWTSVPPPSVSTNWILNGVYFASPTEGWAVGIDYTNIRGVLLHFTGSTWTSVPPPSVSTNWQLYGVNFTSPAEGWAVGWDATNRKGVLLHFTGSTWTSVPPPSVSTNWQLYGVYFTSASEGWAVGIDWTNQKGVLLHYSGGAWTSVPPPSVSTSWHLEGIYFSSPAEGWAVGWDATNQKGVLLRYSGSTWTSVTPPSINLGWGLNSVYFTSPSEGWAAGGYEEGKGVLVHFMSPISPNEGTIGTELTITGSGFGTRKGKVLLGTAVLKILEWTDESIQCQLPKSLSAGTYDVTIKPQAKGSSPIIIANGFMVKAPEIDSVNPTSGSIGDEITMNGFFYGTKRGKVTLGGKSCRMLSWGMDSTTGESEIHFVVPRRLSPEAQELKMTNGVGADTIDFTVN